MASEGLSRSDHQRHFAVIGSFSICGNGKILLAQADESRLRKLRKMMKVKDLAEICGVSEQAIRQFFSKNSFTKVNGKWQPTEQEIESLLSYYRVDLAQADESNLRKLSQADESVSDAVSILCDQLETLQEQLRVKDRQIEDLQSTINDQQDVISKQQDTISNLIETNKALAASNAVQIAAEKKSLLIEPTESSQESQETSQEEPKKKGFWARLFGF